MKLVSYVMAKHEATRRTLGPSCTHCGQNMQRVLPVNGLVDFNLGSVDMGIMGGMGSIGQSKRIPGRAPRHDT